MIAGKIKEL